MAFDELLADRIRAVFRDKRVDFEEKRMMGGLAFMVDDKMCVGTIKNELMARVGAEQHEAAIIHKGCRTMDLTKRPMKGFVFVEPAVIDKDADLAYWV